MIKPINDHILIEPVKRDDFIPTQSGQYQEIGVVLDLPTNLKEEIHTSSNGSGMSKSGVPIKKGDKVIFDAWLAKKYPKEGSNEHLWLVHYQDIVAYEESVSE